MDFQQRRVYCSQRLSLHDFSDSDMGGSIFADCDLDGCSFDGSRLVGSIFRNCDLLDSSFCKANLALSIFSGCSLKDTKFDEADLRDITFSGCYLDNTSGLKNLPMRCPEMGGFIAWKKGYVNEGRRAVIVKLFIPSSAKRSSAGGNKCRASKAEVLAITDMRDASVTYDHCFSSHNPSFMYKVGWYVEPDEFDENRWNECSNGIHFFVNKQEAINYL